jgi:hypothetical protein
VSSSRPARCFAEGVLGARKGRGGASSTSTQSPQKRNCSVWRLRDSSVRKAKQWKGSLIWALWWALEDSNLRPLACKASALTSELSARRRPRGLDRLAAHVPARPAHDLPEHRREPGRAAGLAPVELDGPVRSLLLAGGADQDLASTGGRPHPRPLPLVGVVGGPATEVAPRPVLRRDRFVGRDHGGQGYRQDPYPP